MARTIPLDTQWLDEPQAMRFLRIRDRVKFWRKIALGELPRPVLFSKASLRWMVGDLRLAQTRRTANGSEHACA